MLFLNRKRVAASYGCQCMSSVPGLYKPCKNVAASYGCQCTSGVPCLHKPCKNATRSLRSLSMLAMLALNTCTPTVRPGSFATTPRKKPDLSGHASTVTSCMYFPLSPRLAWPPMSNAPYVPLYCNVGLFANSRSASPGGSPPGSLRATPSVPCSVPPNPPSALAFYVWHVRKVPVAGGKVSGGEPPPLVFSAFNLLVKVGQAMRLLIARPDNRKDLHAFKLRKRKAYRPVFYFNLASSKAYSPKTVLNPRFLCRLRLSLWPIKLAIAIGLALCFDNF